MADTKISALSPLLGSEIADTDEFVVVDKSDLTMSGTGTNKRIVFGEVVDGVNRRDLAIDQWTCIGGLFP